VMPEYNFHDTNVMRQGGYSQAFMR
jgi:hypothetical protein